jgi:hypothetical protein
VLPLRLELSVTAQERFKAGRKGKLSSVLPPTSASVEPADDLGDNAYRNGGERHVAKYNNNGQYNELTMHVWTISWLLQPMLLQSDPACQQ